MGPWVWSISVIIELLTRVFRWPTPMWERAPATRVTAVCRAPSSRSTWVTAWNATSTASSADVSPATRYRPSSRISTAPAQPITVPRTVLITARCSAVGWRLIWPWWGTTAPDGISATPASPIRPGIAPSSTRASISISEPFSIEILELVRSWSKIDSVLHLLRLLFLVPPPPLRWVQIQTWHWQSDRNKWNQIFLFSLLATIIRKTFDIRQQLTQTEACSRWNTI